MLVMSEPGLGKLYGNIIKVSGASIEYVILCRPFYSVFKFLSSDSKYIKLLFYRLIGKIDKDEQDVEPGQCLDYHIYGGNVLLTATRWGQQTRHGVDGRKDSCVGGWKERETVWTEGRDVDE